MRALATTLVLSLGVYAVGAEVAEAQRGRTPPAPRSLSIQDVAAARGNVEKTVSRRPYAGYFAVFGDRPGVIVGSYSPRLNRVQGTYLDPYTVCNGELPRVTITGEAATFLSSTYAPAMQDLDAQLAPFDGRTVGPANPPPPPTPQKKETDVGLAVVACLVEEGGRGVCGLVAEEPPGEELGEQALESMETVTLKQSPGECTVRIFRFQSASRDRG